MYTLIIIAFIAGYSAIALEHPLQLNKAASAIFTAVICWVLIVFGHDTFPSFAQENFTVSTESQIIHHLGEIGSILFFLLGAMTIVELIDVHGGFSIITAKIATRKKSRLLVLFSIVTFFMSAMLDNLTTAIVMASLLRKLVDDQHDRWLFAGMIVIAANAGGAWSPIGDVTTIMLWIGGQITAGNIILKLFIPSLVCLIIPLLMIMRQLKGTLDKTGKDDAGAHTTKLPSGEQRLVLILGLGALLFVPVFKSVTHLPPFMGILFGLSILWGTTELMHRKKAPETRKTLSIAGVLQRIDTPSILFFLGILLAVAALQTAGHLGQLASFLDQHIGDVWIINIIIGFLSAIVDNVPLVAGAIGMYDLSVFTQDHIFWELLAYCAGTGGSCLIIGSAAGVAIMGILKIDFIWYLKHISLPAAFGYLAGVGCFWLLSNIHF